MSCGNYLISSFRENLGNIYRELKVALTPIPRQKKWLFVVGCYNSGTTLLVELLGRHPDISALPTEGHFITDQFIKDYEIGLPRMWANREELFRLTEDDEGPDPIRIKKEWGMRLDLKKPVLLEKSPTNSARTRWLNLHFNPAYFVCIVRNGYAVSEGIRRKGDPKHLKDGWPIEMCAYQWFRTYELLQEDSVYLSNFMTIKYEDLVADPISEINKILTFIDLERRFDFDKNTFLSIHERSTPIKNFNDASINNLSDDDIIRINNVASLMLEKFKYSLIK